MHLWFVLLFKVVQAGDFLLESSVKNWHVMMVLRNARDAGEDERDVL